MLLLKWSDGVYDILCCCCRFVVFVFRGGVANGAVGFWMPSRSPLDKVNRRRRGGFYWDLFSLRWRLEHGSDGLVRASCGSGAPSQVGSIVEKTKFEGRPRRCRGPHRPRESPGAPLPAGPRIVPIGGLETSLGRGASCRPRGRCGYAVANWPIGIASVGRSDGGRGQRFALAVVTPAALARNNWRCCFGDSIVGSIDW